MTQSRSNSDLRAHSNGDAGELALASGHRMAWMGLGDSANRTVLLLHGFASTARVNWFGTGWAETLVDAGYHVLAIDHRGHGGSSKYYAPTDYGPDIFAADAIDCLDAFDLTRVAVIGYSMGARITSWLAAHYPDRVACAVFGGMGEHIYGGRGGYEAIADALETDDVDAIADLGAKSFRLFADRTKSDRLALAACIRPSTKQITPDVLSAIQAPVLVAVGADDGIAGRAEPLLDVLAHGEAITMPGLDHMRATGAAPFKERTLTFLAEHFPA
ncbi:MAG: alpha/beta hydrolase [Pseudomonadota bacterium]